MHSNLDTVCTGRDTAVLPGRSEEMRIVAAYERRARQIGRERYSTFHPGNLALRHARERAILAALDAAGYRQLETKRILDVGCGTGSGLRDFIRWGARPENLTGLELLPEKVAEARRLCPARVALRSGTATALDVPDASFDLVFQSTMFTSILDAETKRKVARECLRVVKSDGMILWYDFRYQNPANPDVRGIGRSEIWQLFAGCQIRLRPITLAPPLGRRLAPWSLLLYGLLEKVPPLCSHYLGTIRRRGMRLRD